MILDTSVIVAVLLREPGRDEILAKLGKEEPVFVGAQTLVEAGLVLTPRLGERAIELLREFLRESGAIVLPFGEADWIEAVEAFQRFGKGRHPAALNFGDCMVYASAKRSRQRLLFRGNDFARTDLDLEDLGPTASG